MRNSSHDTANLLSLYRVTQKTNAHCGPAVAQMLLSYIGLNVSQDAIVVAGEAQESLQEYGMRVDQIAMAVHKLVPSVNFLFKNKATYEDLKKIILDYKYPVGVEWQGIFDFDDEEDEDEDEDSGHYSVVIGVHDSKHTITIADPYKNYSSEDRILTVTDFLHRWWDTNEIIDAKTGKTEIQYDQHMMFIIVPKNERFPQDLDLQIVS